MIPRITLQNINHSKHTLYPIMHQNSMKWFIIEIKKENLPLSTEITKSGPLIMFKFSTTFFLLL